MAKNSFFQGDFEDILLAKNPHLFIWISNGKELDKGGNPIIAERQLPLPDNQKFSYLEILKKGCTKLSQTKTPAFTLHRRDSYARAGAKNGRFGQSIANEKSICD